MMSPSTIAHVARAAAKKAAKEKQIPLMVELDDMVNKEVLRDYLNGMPFLGTYHPKGYKLIKEYFVDASGWGTAGGSAISQDAFLSEVKEGHAYAITESGQFQVYIGEYKKVDKKVK